MSRSTLSGPRDDQAMNTQGGECFEPATRQRVRLALLSWYDQEKRDLPWRRTRDPYVILVSEYMLQQTQVKTVLPYFAQFISSFPDLKALAEAEMDEVLKVWEGLGYYRRARMLKQLAEVLVNERGGQFPESHEALLELPGIGPYTAAAVASMAFGQAKGVVDGNVYRVFSRLFDLDWDCSKSKGKKAFQSVANQIIDPERPGDFNQAVMELGATLCKPRNPTCPECPLAEVCRTHNFGLDPGLRPVKSAKVKVRKQKVNWGWFERDQRIWLCQRPEAGLMSGFWELPSLETRQFKGLKPIYCFEYRYSHILSQIRVFDLEASLDSTDPQGEWFTPRDLERLPLTGATRKVLEFKGWEF